MSSRWKALAGLGQSVWYDNVARPALASGHLAQLVREDNVTGGTSNPSIFSKAVLESDLYDEEIRSAPSSDSDAQVFERCAVEDIQRACDLVRPVWERTEGQDGYVSIEEEAALAFEVEPAVRRAHELRALVDRPNVMVKIPGTEAGVEAFRRLTREGQSINMTLLFSRERYRQIAESYVDALEERIDAGEDVSAIASVASFFVSRVDTEADRRLPADSPLRGRAAVANAKLAYADVFAPSLRSERWARLRAAGANVQRPLWASTGVKSPDYSPTLYIDELIGEHTVTTVPDATLDAFRDAQAPPPSRAMVLDGVDEAREQLAALAAAGVSLDEITDQLERDGVRQFSQASEAMIQAIAHKRERVGVTARRATARAGHGARAWAAASSCSQTTVAVPSPGLRTACGAPASTRRTSSGPSSTGSPPTSASSLPTATTYTDADGRTSSGVRLAGARPMSPSVIRSLRTATPGLRSALPSPASHVACQRWKPTSRAWSPAHDGSRSAKRTSCIRGQRVSSSGPG